MVDVDLDNSRHVKRLWNANTVICLHKLTLALYISKKTQDIMGSRVRITKFPGNIFVYTPHIKGECLDINAKELHIMT